MAQIKDPWNQNFTTFKTYCRSKRPAPENPPFSIFNANELKDLINLGASHIVIYALEDPNNAQHKIMTAVGVAPDNTGKFFKRVNSDAVQYVVPEHNCPPDCDVHAIQIIESVSLHKDPTIT